MSLNLRLPGGVNLTLADIEGEAGYNRIGDMIQTALSPFKIVFDLINIVIQIKTTLTKATDIPSDPSSFLDEMIKLTGMISQLSQYIPQLRVPLMVKDSLLILINMLDVMLVKIASLNSILAKKASIEVKVALDANLQMVADIVQAQYDTEFETLKKMFEPIEAILLILDILGQLIAIKIQIPDIEDTDSLSEIENIISELKTYLERLYANIS
jgi:hypothetical protein